MKYVRPIITLLLVAATLVVNALSTLLPINGVTPAEISDSFPVYFVPAGYVFSIWGLIYVMMIAFAVWQLLPKNVGRKELRELDVWFWMSCLANITWIFLWHYGQITVSVVSMVALLISLVVLYIKTHHAVFANNKDWLTTTLTFSTYLGWITVATVANITIAFYNLGFRGGPVAPEGWATILVIVAGILGIVALVTRQDYAYSLVIAWALGGIAVKFSNETYLFGMSIIMAAALFLGCGATYYALLQQGKGKLSGA